MAQPVFVPTVSKPESLTSSELRKLALDSGQCRETPDGALVLYTGKFTGRSPRDRFIVRDGLSATTVDWGSRNQAISPENYLDLAAHVRWFLGSRRVFEVRAQVGGAYGSAVRVLTTSPAHALFSRHLFQAEKAALSSLPSAVERTDNAVRSTAEAGFGDITVLHAPECRATPQRHGTISEVFVVLSPGDRTILIGGTAYAGEIKKAVFSLMSLLLPEEGILPMHAAVNVGESGDSAVFFGLSGTGKTTLSADPERLLLGDDEHGWCDEGVFNLEGGCYAKTIGLREEQEPDIWRAVHQPFALLENVPLEPLTGAPLWDDRSLTENTRGAYPLSALPRVWNAPLARHPRHVIFLTADAFGVLPPLAALSLDQAVYYFLSGYTAKLAGTERGLVQPEPTFSTCFGSPFMPRPPVLYAELLRERVKAAGARVWLVNTGWIGGPYGEGQRIAIADTRRIVGAILNDEIDTASLRLEPRFGLAVPSHVPGLADGVLDIRGGYRDPSRYDRQAAELARRFSENFAAFAGSVSPEVVAAGPPQPRAELAATTG